MVFESNKKNNPLIYVSIIIVLIILIVILASIFVYLYNQAYQCINNPDIICWDTWQCITGGFPSTHCQDKTGHTGLASCIYGPDARVNNVCFNDPNGAECDCKVKGNNCLSTCATSIQQSVEKYNNICNCNNPDCT